MNKTQQVFFICLENGDISPDSLEKLSSYIQDQTERTEKAENSVTELRAQVERMQNAIRLEEAKYKDLDRTVNNWLNDVWGIVYPQNSTGWEYPGQVYRHLRDYVGEKEAEIEKLFYGLCEIDRTAQKELRDSYERDKGINPEVSILRSVMRQMGIIASQALKEKAPAESPVACPDCGSEFTDGKDQGHYLGCPKAITDYLKKDPNGKYENNSKEYIAKGGILDGMRFTQEDIEESRVIKSIVDKQLNETFTVGVDPARPGGEFTSSVGFEIKEGGKIEVLGIPVNVRADMPKRYGILTNVGEPELSDLIQDVRLETLRRENERQKRIDKKVKNVIQPQEITLNLEVSIPPAFYRLRKLVEELQEKIRQENLNEFCQMEVNVLLNQSQD